LIGSSIELKERGYEDGLAKETLSGLCNGIPLLVSLTSLISIGKEDNLSLSQRKEYLGLQSFKTSWG
jgi:hypothetical protein